MPHSKKELDMQAATDFMAHLEEHCLAKTMKKAELESVYKDFSNCKTEQVTFKAVLNHLSYRMDAIHVVGDKVVFGSGEQAAREMLSEALTDDDITSQEETTQHKLYCSTCKRDFQDALALKQHEKSVLHRQQELLGVIRKSLDKNVLIRDKNGIGVTSKPEGNDDGVIELVVHLHEADQILLTVNNTDDTRTTTLTYITLLWSTVLFDYNDIRIIDRDRGTLRPGNSEVFKVGCKRRNEYGYSFVPVVFSFETEEMERTGEIRPMEFHILRFLCVRAVGELYPDLKAISPYEKPPKPDYVHLDIKTEPGLKLPPLKRDGLQMVNVKEFLIPPLLRQAVKTSDMCPTDIRDLLGGELSFDFYNKKMSMLLHIEEIQMWKDIRTYDMNNVTFTRDKGSRLLILKVPGLAENRPSVLRGDRLFAYEQGSRQRRYEGIVHAVELLDVKLGFSKKMPFIANKKFEVHFTFNRLPVRMQHRACKELAENKNTKDVLFPEQHTIRRRGVNDVTIRSFYDRKLNKEQRAAVTNIVCGTSRPAPYLIFGPPGTGKTVTLVESIKQVHHLIDDAIILACAPDNSAADLIAERLLPHIDKGKMFRMYASSRTWSGVPQTLKDARVVNFEPVSHEAFYPRKEDMCKYRIIVTTLITAGRLVSAKFGRCHFTHIFIDESGHAMEPECIIPIAGLLDPGFPDPQHPDMGRKRPGQLVLAGDPKQLGPVLRSKLAKDHGLEISLLERLMKSTCNVYKKQAVVEVLQEVEHIEDKAILTWEYNSNVLTKLVNNYRSHRDIITVPKELFYDGELNECAGDFRNVMLGWEELPNKDFPIIFHPVFGLDEREERSPSFFNIAEVETVEKYLKKLLDDRVRSKKMKMIKPEMIGIISPYKRQVLKIQKMVQKRRFGDIKVGSVEEFQGQERRIIIISTVRSAKREYMDLDKKHGLGFVGNPKRFNVAITRAQALLILIGNPEMLGKDENWDYFLLFCHENKGCIEVSPRDHAKDITTLLKQLKLTTTDVEVPPEEEFQISNKELHEQPEWPRHE